MCFVKERELVRESQAPCILSATVVPHHVLPGPQVRDLKGRRSQAPCILRATVVLHHVLPGPQVRDLKGRESQAPRILRAPVVVQHVLSGLQVGNLKARESQAPCTLRATVVLQHVLPGPQVRDLKRRERIASSLHSSRNGGAPSCAPWSPGSRFQGKRFASCLHFFAQRWCSIMCSLVPSFETHSKMCVDFCTLGGWFSNGDLPSKSGALFWAAAAHRFAPVKIRLPNGHAEVCFGLSSSTLSSVPIVFHCFIPHKFVRLERVIWSSAALCE